MSNYLVDGADLTSVANAIRTKGGTSAQLAFPQGFVDAVDAIETGGGGWTTDGIAGGTEPSGEIEITVSSIAANAFRGKTGITRVVIPGTCSIGNAAFYDCTGLISVFAPNSTSASSDNFRRCSKLNYLVFGNFNNKSYATTDCKLLALDLQRGNLISLGTSNTGLSVIVLRSSTLQALGNVSHLNGTPFASGGSGGTLYVPQDLIASYQSATNWSTILGYANNQILPIEGSIYETQYVDGTPIPTT